MRRAIVESWRRWWASLAQAPPGRLALLLAVGFVAGIFPMMGIPTALCLLAAAVFRLDAAALQAVNTVTSPLQIALLMPLARVGARLLGVNLAAGTLTAKLGLTAVCAVTGWTCVCFPLGVLLYVGLGAVMAPEGQDRRRRCKRVTAQIQSPADTNVNNIIPNSKWGVSAIARQICRAVISPKITAVTNT